MESAKTEESGRRANVGAGTWEAQSTLAWKANHYDWGLLNGYWQANMRTR